ncbi:hypothetical protein ST201phi2-1p412 [Pseudomonas phage 201phi2-1]|uniref:Uncharacterized protein n=1 Tax=Pseudomonas phage 201phi2-1 TaxID=198110 RepID=B3FJS1_BP201|nr:hypothetical protein ST201phi2-1p412 [Pseudomonas phage 201phi2-1]ABY63236.1 hypothetical protein 201phi2-1p412 [Pseudomonas phage 201phi2-1]
MAEMLIHWYSNLPDSQLVSPQFRREALCAVTELTAYDAIHHIVRNSPEAFQVYVGYPSYLIIRPSVGGLFTTSEMRYQSQLPEGGYSQLHSVGTNTAFDAMINLKQRYEWEMANGQ